jgi:hypothetical protein
VNQDLVVVKFRDAQNDLDLEWGRSSCRQGMGDVLVRFTSLLGKELGVWCFYIELDFLSANKPSQHSRTLMTHPFVYLSLNARLSRRAGLIHDIE